jgi:hypothetical protein
MRFHITLAEHISARGRENLMDVFARLGAATESLPNREIAVEVRSSEKADRLRFVLRHADRDGALRWSEENSD